MPSKLTVSLLHSSSQQLGGESSRRRGVVFCVAFVCCCWVGFEQHGCLSAAAACHLRFLHRPAIITPHALTMTECTCSMTAHRDP